MIQIMFERLFSGKVAGVRRKRIEAHGHVFLRGRPVTHIFLVHSGRVRLERDLPDGPRVAVGCASAGETFAEAALYAKTYHCDAICVASSEISCAPVREVRRALAADSSIAAQYAEHLSCQIRDLRSRLELRNIKRAPDRLMAWLQLKARGNPAAYAPNTSWADVALEIGLTPEAIYRALAHLERSRQVMRHEGRRVTLRS